MLPPMIAKLVFRQEKLTEAEWTKLITWAVSTLKRGDDFKKFCTTTLGGLECMECEVRCEISSDVDEVNGSDKPASQIRGIFVVYHDERFKGTGFDRSSGGDGISPNGTKHIWGLTRNGKWVLVDVPYKGTPGYKNRGAQKAQSIEYREVDFQDIIRAGVKLKSIWEIFFNLLNNWVEQKAHDLERLKEKRAQLKLADEILNVTQ